MGRIEDLVNDFNSTGENFEVILEYFDRDIQFLSSKYFLIGSSRDDIRQELSIALFKATSKFDVSKSSFRTFAILCMNSHIQNEIMKSNSQSRKGDVVYVSDHIELRTNLSPERLLLDKEFEKETFIIIDMLLSSHEKDVMELSISGHTYIEIAEMLGITPKQADNTLQRARRKLKKGL